MWGWQYGTDYCSTETYYLVDLYPYWLWLDT
jgi:hypothetical protein